MHSAWQDDGYKAALAAGYCKPPMCGGSLRPWAPLFVPPRLNGKTLDILLPALVALNRDYLKDHPDTPPIYSSGVWYEAEPPGHEQWLTIPWILMRRDQGRGSDCEDLACWRAAELQLRLGERAEAIWSCRQNQQGQRVYHIRVRRGPNMLDKNGNRLIEDPSANLGMNRAMTELFTEPHWRGNPSASAPYFQTFITDGERT